MTAQKIRSLFAQIPATTFIGESCRTVAANGKDEDMRQYVRELKAQNVDHADALRRAIPPVIYNQLFAE